MQQDKEDKGEEKRIRDELKELADRHKKRRELNKQKQSQNDLEDVTTTTTTTTLQNEQDSCDPPSTHRSISPQHPAAFNDTTTGGIMMSTDTAAASADGEAAALAGGGTTHTQSPEAISKSRRGSNQSQEVLEKRLSIRKELQSIQRAMSQNSHQPVDKGSAMLETASILSGDATLTRKESIIGGGGENSDISVSIDTEQDKDLEKKLSIRKELQSIQRSISHHSQQSKSTMAMDAADASPLSGEATLVSKESLKSNDQLQNQQKRGISIREELQSVERSILNNSRQNDDSGNKNKSSSGRAASVVSGGDSAFCLNDESVKGQLRSMERSVQDRNDDKSKSDSAPATVPSASAAATRNDTNDQMLPKSLRGLRPGDPRPGAYEFYRVRPPQAGPVAPSAQPEPTEEDNVVLPDAHTDQEDRHQAFEDGGGRKYFFTHWNRRTKLILVGILVMIITVGVAVAVTFTKQPAGDSGPCALKGPQPNVHIQCECVGTVKVVSDATKRQYGLLQTSIDLFPQEANFMYSCDPRNVALLLVSSMDTAAKSTEQMLLERYVLNLLYLSWSGPKWKLKKGWLGLEDVCAWSGVTCNGDKSVVGLDLSENRLEGAFVSEIGFLSSLTTIDFQGNSLSGDLCTDIGLLKNLTRLQLGRNSIGSGYGIPSEIGNLEKLQVLGLRANSFVGKVPSELSRLTNLVDFSVTLNSIFSQGPLPLWNLSLLTNLDAGKCGITGSIPAQIGLMKGLTSLHLYDNFLTNTIPSEIGLLTDLIEIMLFSNDITGTIPTTIAKLGKLKSLEVQANQLTGIVPSEVGLVTRLTSLDISSNSVNGTIPLEMTNCSWLRQFIASSNQLTGTLPDEALGRLTNLESLKLDRNLLFGSPSSESTTGLCNLRINGKLTSLTTRCPETVCSCCTPC
jgi:Leucine-rich repeat (LRR) protein